MPAEIRSWEKRSGSPAMGAHTSSLTDGRRDQASWLRMILTRALTHLWCEVLATRTCGGLR
jgi:hypothetical protein